MAPIVYQYLNNPDNRDPVEDAPIPNNGDVRERKGQHWFVDAVTTVLNAGVLEYYVVNLMPRQKEHSDDSPF